MCSLSCCSIRSAQELNLCKNPGDAERLTYVSIVKACICLVGQTSEVIIIKGVTCELSGD